MQKPQFRDNYIYHVFNRGVDKRTIFMDGADYYRFVHQLYEFNNEDRVQNVRYYFDPETMSVESRPVKRIVSERKKLVDIFVFTLMPNHFHLMLRQRIENGIVKFMQKLGTGYTMYFNKRYERTGSLLQGRFKAVMLSRREHFVYLPYYIHTNPLSLNYRGSTSIDWRMKLDYLTKYRWSSFPDYIGRKNFPSITERAYILNVFGGEAEYKQHTASYLKEASGNGAIESIQDVKID